VLTCPQQGANIRGNEKEPARVNSKDRQRSTCEQCGQPPIRDAAEEGVSPNAAG
jgi:hypothetical protein